MSTTMNMSLALLLAGFADEALAIQRSSTNTKKDNSIKPDAKATAKANPSPAPAPAPAGKKSSGDDATEESSGWFDSSSCFPGDSMVMTQEGFELALAELQIGDVVNTAAGFEPVTGFLHKSEERLEFTTLSFDNEKTFTATDSHRVFLADGTSAVVSDIKIGDVLLQNDQAVTVSSKKSSVHQGYYAPLTHSGTIAVDGTMASCYIGGSVGSLYQSLAKMVLAPFHYFVGEPRSQTAPAKVMMPGLTSA